MFYLLQNENVKSVKDALEQLVCKESLQGYTCTKSKVEVRPRLSVLSVVSYTLTFAISSLCNDVRINILETCTSFLHQNLMRVLVQEAFTINMIHR